MFDLLQILEAALLAGRAHDAALTKTSSFFLGQLDSTDVACQSTVSWNQTTVKAPCSTFALQHSDLQSLA
jgi:hypothetical protein